ncbi:unnamed protein product [Symbiodinium natans]|uniref:PPM-type phosphatase domain-containing protein n=1 Tax=Symbiodinium natans TaxID=878477 RepID=A0A812K943_9DINO|nr:unnamed protein product [Symbiodinium natans]
MDAMESWTPAGRLHRPPRPTGATPATTILRGLRGQGTRWSAAAASLFAASRVFHGHSRPRARHTLCSALDTEWPAGASPEQAETCGCGASSVGGCDPDRPKVNQDACYVEELPDGRLQAAVFDGHGKKGHVVSGALKALLPSLVAERMASEGSGASSALAQAFEASDGALRGGGAYRRRAMFEESQPQELQARFLTEPKKGAEKEAAEQEPIYSDRLWTALRTGSFDEMLRPNEAE